MRITLAWLLGLLLSFGAAGVSEGQLSPSGTGGVAALATALRQLGSNKRVLMIGAHPDDEDTQLLVLLSRGMGAQAIADSFSLRRTALTHGIPYYTTVAGARAAVQAIGALRAGSLEVAPLQSYL